MKTKEEIIEILEKEFGYIYCHNCKHNLESNSCDECHRKYMNWEISPETAERLAYKILS